MIRRNFLKIKDPSSNKNRSYQASFLGRIFIEDIMILTIKDISKNYKRFKKKNFKNLKKKISWIFLPKKIKN